MPELVCDTCGSDYVVWSAPDDVWNAVERNPDGSDIHPFLCPGCFMQRADHLAPTGWVVGPRS